MKSLNIRSAIGNPLFRIGATVFALKTVLITFFAFQTASLADKWTVISISVLFQLIFVSGFYGLLNIVRVGLANWRRTAEFVITFTTLLAVIVTFVDQYLALITGMRFTPTILRTYGIGYVLHRDVLYSILQNLTVTIIALVILMGLIYLIVRTIRKAGAVQANERSWGIVSIPAVALVLGWFSPAAFQGYYYQARPAELSFLKPEFYGGNKSGSVGSIAEAGWIDYWKFPGNGFEKIGDAPFYVQSIPAETEPVDSLPDIILMMTESLRGQELFWIDTVNAVPTPNLKRLSEGAVFFSKFVSNGFPTDDGVFSSMSSIIPHYIKKNERDAVNTRFTFLPKILSDAGYETAVLWAADPAEHYTKRFHEWFDRYEFECNQGDEQCSDRVFYDFATNWLKKFDAEQTGKPLFLYMHTLDLHYPFNPKLTGSLAPYEEEYKAFSKNLADDRLRYRETLEWVDRGLAGLTDYLESRPRSRNTIIIFMGDHAYEAGEKFAQSTRLYPTNAHMLTGAFIKGPEKWVRRASVVDSYPASQVDLIPTIVRMLKLNTPIASMGRDLLDDANIPFRTSISVRPAGIRYNWSDSSLYVNSYNPGIFWVTKFEEQPGNAPAGGSARYQKMAKDMLDLARFSSSVIDADALIPKE